MSSPLFREAAVTAQSERLCGELLVSQPLSTRLLVLALVIVTLIGGVWLAANGYQRKVTVPGQLVPSAGLVDLTATIGGSVTAVLVRSGQRVEMNEPLFVVDTPRNAGGADSVGLALLSTLREQAASLQRQLELEYTGEARLQGAYANERTLAETVVQERAATLQRQQQALAIRERQTARARRLMSQSLLSASDFDAIEMQWLQQQQMTAEAALAVTQAETAAQSLQRQVEERTLQSRQLQQRLMAELDQNQRQQLQQETELHAVVLAPVAGEISAVLAKTGMTVRPQQSLGALVPADSELRVELQIPSHAVGFLEESQHVKLRLDAFPYQKFGVQEATVVSVPGSAEYSESGPFYRVQAALKRQSIAAYGSEQPLMPGMRVSADIRIDERTLLEWLLDPLYSIKGY